MLRAVFFSICAPSGTILRSCVHQVSQVFAEIEVGFMAEQPVGLRICVVNWTVSVSTQDKKRSMQEHTTWTQFEMLAGYHMLLIY